MFGLKELGARMKQLQTDVAFKAARSSTARAANVIRKRAVQKAPEAPSGISPKVPPKNLKNNIRTKYIKDSDLTSEHVVFVRGGKKAHYASRYGSIQEFGSVKQGAQPFMRPAFDDSKDEAARAMTGRLAEEINKANK